MPTFSRSWLAMSTAPVLSKLICRVSTYGRSGCGGGCCGFGITVTLGTSAATRSRKATASFMSSNDASGRGSATRANGDAPWSGNWASSCRCTYSDWEPSTSKPPPVRLPDWLSARCTEGTRRRIQTANTAQRNLRRLLLTRIMNCWMGSPRFLPGVS